MLSGRADFHFFAISRHAGDQAKSARVAGSAHGERRRLDAAVIGPGVVVLAVDAGALVVSCPWLKWPKSNSKVQYSIVGVQNKKIGQRRRKSGGGKRVVPGKAISTLPRRRGGAPTPVLSPARRSAAVRMGRGGTARPPEAGWSSGVAAFLGGVITKIFLKMKKNATTTTLAFVLRNIMT